MPHDSGSRASTSRKDKSDELARTCPTRRPSTAKLDFDNETFDGVSAFYSVSHTPRGGHAALFQRVARWLKSGGYFLASLGAVDSPDWTGEWLDVPMFFSSYDADTNRNSLRAAGFTLLLDEVVAMQEPEARALFLWVLAQKA